MINHMRWELIRLLLEFITGFKTAWIVDLTMVARDFCASVTDFSVSIFPSLCFVMAYSSSTGSVPSCNQRCTWLAVLWLIGFTIWSIHPENTSCGKQVFSWVFGDLTCVILTRIFKSKIPNFQDESNRSHDLLNVFSHEARLCHPQLSSSLATTSSSAWGAVLKH